MSKNRSGADFKLIEKIFDQLSSSVAIAMLKNERLTYEFYGGRKAAQAEAGDEGARPKKGFMQPKKNAARPAEPGVSRTTRFNLGSASSMFTGALAVKLMEFDELRLGDPVNRFIPEFVNDDVTAYHLLTQTSGLACESLPLPDNKAAKNEFYRKLYGGLKQAAAPGAKSGYFQYNYAILADIIERISGRELEELASVLLFIPLNMKHTTYFGSALKDGQYVIPWNHKENRFMGELHGKQPTGHTGIYTTALDLVRFGRMFLNGGECEGKTVFLESSAEFMLREVTGGRYMRTPLFYIKRNVDIYGCFSETLSPEAVALTGDTGCMLFIDPARRTAGAALANSTWVHSVSQNYSNIVDILASI